MTNLFNDADEIAKLQARVAKLQAKLMLATEGPWKPKRGDVYWQLSSNGEIDHFTWNGDEIDEDIYAQGRVFPTKEAAEKFSRRERLLASLFRMATGDGNVTGYYITLWSGCVGIDERYYGIPGAPRFASREEALAAIDKYGDEIRELL